MGELLVLVGVAGLVFGLVNLVRPSGLLRIRNRGQAGLLLGASFLIAVLGGGIASSGEATDSTFPSSDTALADQESQEIAVDVTTTTAATTPTHRPDPETTARGGAVTEPATPAGDGEVVGELVVWFFDVGQGDATLLQGPDFTILIDAGRHDRTDVVPHLRAAGVTRIDLLVGTHPHADHIGQYPQVLEAFPVTEVWMSGDTTTTLTFERVLDAILASDASYHEPRAGEVFRVGSARLEVVNPTRVSGDLHDGSGCGWYSARWRSCSPGMPRPEPNRPWSTGATTSGPRCCR